LIVTNSDLVYRAYEGSITFRMSLTGPVLHTPTPTPTPIPPHHPHTDFFDIVRWKSIKNDERDDPQKGDKEKKIDVLGKECFRSVFLMPVEGMRDRWSG